MVGHVAYHHEYWVSTYLGYIFLIATCMHFLLVLYMYGEMGLHFFQFGVLQPDLVEGFC